MLYDKIKTYGVTLTSPDVPHSAGIPAISTHVIKEGLAAPCKTIQDSPEYQCFLQCKSGSWIGPDPVNNGRQIHAYLWYNSERKGPVGKVCGLIYRIVERVREIFSGRSDRLTALDEIEDLLLQAHKLATKTYNPGPLAGCIPVVRHVPDEIKANAQALLATMLARYNTILIRA